MVGAECVEVLGVDAGPAGGEDAGGADEPVRGCGVVGQGGAGGGGETALPGRGDGAFERGGVGQRPVGTYGDVDEVGDGVGRG